MLAMGRVHDISVTLGTESIDYPGDTPYARSLLMSVPPDFCTLSRLEMSAHSGTHIDVPYHFEAGGRRLGEYAAADFIFPAVVIEVADVECVRAAEIAAADVRAGDAVLFKTANSRDGRVRNGRFTEHFVYVAPDAAEWLCGRGAKLVGIDYITIEGYANREFDSHHIVLGAGMIVLESVDLGAVLPGRYTLFCLPLKLDGAEASPVRAILVEDVA
ncbi:MAG: cyclase family protein [Gammaproteobacteria bacterium]